MVSDAYRAAQAAGIGEKPLRRAVERLEAEPPGLQRRRFGHAFYWCAGNQEPPANPRDAQPVKFEPLAVVGQEPALKTAESKTAIRNKPGRPAGSIDREAAQRNKKMRAAHRNGEFVSIAALAKAFHVSRAHASEIVNTNE